MSLSVEMSTRLDTGSASATLTGSLSASQDDLGNITIDISADAVASAAGAAQGIDLSPLQSVVEDAVTALSGTVADIPVAGDLIAPIQSGIDVLQGALSGALEQDIRASLDTLGQSFDDLDAGSGLDALKRLAEGVSGSGDLSALRDVITGVLGVGGSGGLPETKIDDVITGTISALDALGSLMTLETLLSEARKMGALTESHLPDGRAEALMALWDQELAALEQQLATIDPSDTAAVEAALIRLGAVRTRADGVLEGLREAMAMGEATLTVLDPERLVTRAEAVLERLRSAGIAQLRDAMAHLAGQLQPLTQFDLSGLAETSLDALLTQIEAHASEMATDIDGVDVSAISAPITDTFGTITQVATDLRTGIETAMQTITAALDEVRKAVEALPFDQVAQMIQDVIGTIAGVLDQLSDLLGGIQDAIGDGAELAQAALDQAESAINSFRDTLDDLFGQAQGFVLGLNLDQVVGQTADAIQTVADVIGKADMAPYFNTAQGAIKTTAGVVDKVPFALLPDDLEQELVDVIRPVKAVDLDDFAQEIKDVLQINPDGSFSLRPDLETAVQGVQDKITELISTLEGLDPRLLATEIDGALGALETEIRAIEPSVALTPLTDALSEAKALVAGLDLDGLLQPLRDGFAEVLAAVDMAKPSTLLAPIEAQVAEVRQKILDVAKLDQWKGEIDTLEAQFLDLLALADPTQLEGPLTEAFEQLRRELKETGLPDPLEPLGALLSGLLSGGGEDVLARSMDQVARWLRQAESGGAALGTLAQDLSDAVGRTRDAVAAADPDTLADRFQAARDRLDDTVANLPAGPGRDQLAAAVALADLTADLRSLSSPHANYVQYLTDTQTNLTGLIDKGFGEADSVAADLRNAFAPLTDLLTNPREIFRRLGFTRFADGVFGLIDELFEAAPPARLAAILVPIYQSLHGRVSAILTAVLTPVRDFIDELIAIVNAFDLSPITTVLDAAFQTIRDEIAAFHPDVLLGAGLTALQNAQQAISDFDPLGPVVETIDTLQETIARVLELFDGEAILAVPITVYDEIMELLRALDINTLLTPLYDRLDAIAGQVSSGLDGTVDAFQGLQDALPDKVGSITVTASASVGSG